MESWISDERSQNFGVKKKEMTEGKEGMSKARVLNSVK